MPPPLLLSVKDSMVRFREDPVFENLSFNIHEGSRIALVGKNGAGKSTLMNIITGRQELDAGERWVEAATTIGYLHQDITPKPGQTVFEYIFEEIDEGEREIHSYKVDIVAEALHLDTAAKMTRLSGGQLRRAGLARALVEEPSILLLDEPTNHLDLEAIEWLEEYLKSYNGTIMCVSHDRAFLANITNQVFWLDRGKLKVSPRGFKYFDEWAEALLDQEARELKNRKQAVALEVEWASRGVKARRKRNMRRLEQMREMRDQLKRDESAFRRATAKIKIAAQKDDEEGAKVVAEFYNVCKEFADEDTGKPIPILDKFSLRIRRGDRIGILGKNGSGKTTFLKLLLNQLEQDSGSIKVRKELEFSYFDQKRSDLKPDDTLMRTLAPNGGEYISVMGKERHICGYLKDFMFDPSRAHDKVKTLSGGEKNRLMLAKVLAAPKSGLILDEPTNDLDMDTLDMLEEILSKYNGTLLLVSHDRDFLDQTVSKILGFQGGGKVEMVVGGYTDYLRQISGKAPKKKAEKPEAAKPAKPAQEEKPKSKPGKMSYKLERELKMLPGQIEQQETLVMELNDKLADSEFYQRDPEGFHETTKELATAEAKLERLETRWLELEELKANYA